MEDTGSTVEMTVSVPEPKGKVLQNSIKEFMVKQLKFQSLHTELCNFPENTKKIKYVEVCPDKNEQTSRKYWEVGEKNTSPANTIILEK